MSILKLEQVARRFRTRGKMITALKNFSLEVNEGEFLTIVGPSGCGKSTVLNLVSGLLRPSSGKLSYKSRPLNGINTDIGYVTQKDNLLPWRSLLGNVELGMEIRNIPQEARRAKARELIHKVGLGGFENHYPHELSGGMRQRANIIRTLAYDPSVILMDEPFGPLDALTRGLLQNQLLDLWQESQKTVIFITHDLIEAVALADRVVVMTARPGTIRKVSPVPIPRPRDVFRIHEAPGFQETYESIWQEVLAEVRKEGA